MYLQMWWLLPAHEEGEEAVGAKQPDVQALRSGCPLLLGEGPQELHTIFLLTCGAAVQNRVLFPSVITRTYSPSPENTPKKILKQRLPGAWIKRDHAQTNLCMARSRLHREDPDSYRLDFAIGLGEV
ncbi:hypothetical protein Anapl_04856 [Anas platyrhynchos]|uniref:Uncharacterized protein n=1 Tax=Anas platyrhynchos TaxID=8839 RepID=R0KAD5_ANAPL|nr:hypothetical protein Anapl_04856 [Anas platyrhynchos]